MIDQRTLLARLDEYHGSMNRHLLLVREEFERVSTAWAELERCYAGDAADEFKPIWGSASQRFREYDEQTGAIMAALRERIESLREANRAVGLDEGGAGR
jgi:uncharacterized protein YukE